MDISTMLDRRNFRCEISAGSKKHALDLLSAMLAESVPSLSPGEVLEGLASRERLGSTGLGHSVAMPHTRIAGLGSTAAAFLKLAEPIDFGSPDGRPVDLLLGLLVPKESTSQDLKEIGELVKRLRDPELQDKLRSASDPDLIYSLLLENLTPSHAH
jgi:PTS system nitrogen regulatory IIA component